MGRKTIPTVEQNYKFYRDAMQKGKGQLHANKPVVVEEEANKREKGENPDATGKLPTRIVFEGGENVCYREWHAVRRTWMESANGNPTVATQGMLVALRMCSEESRRAIIDNLGEIMARQQAEIDSGVDIPKSALADVDVAEWFDPERNQ